MTKNKIKNHKNKGMTPFEQWSRLPWKAIQVNNQSFGKDASDFMGLEVLSSDSYKLTKNQSGYSLNALKEGTILEENEWDGEEFQDGDEWMEDENNIPKRTNKNIKSIIENIEDNNDDNDNDNDNDNNDNSNSLNKEKKKKKRKTLDSKEDDNNDNKKKRKGLEDVKKDKKVKEEVNVEKEDKVDKKTKKEKKKDKIKANENIIETTVSTISQIDEGDGEWGPVILQKLLYQALIDLGFSTPTPIQAETIPITINRHIDIVGAAETGSGKTLAFGLPIIDYLIRNYQDVRSNPCPCPTAIIIAPTRELALQITSVLKSVCEKFKSKLRLEIVAVVGGMAEQKQRRQLCGNRPVDILVATPGRLSELMEDNEIVAFQNLAYVRYLVVDEADRIMEEGHFSELLRVFSRIKDHEKIMERGEDPVEVTRKQCEGTYEADYDNDVQLDNHDNENDDENDDNDFDDILPKFEPMPTEEQIEEARRRQPKVPYNESKEEEKMRKERMNEEELRLLQFDSNNDSDDRRVYLPRQRQTLLFSATAIQSQIDNDKHKKKKKIKGIGSGAVKNLPYHLQQLLGLVAIRGNTEIVDVTGVSKAIAKKKDNKSEQNNPNNNNKNNNDNEGTFAALPKTLTQFEIRAPTEEKDVMVYYFLLKNIGRTLLFVNSIKTARRVDGLLRALGLNCRTIHAQLQQRQRLRALEGFRSSPIGVLVATDVAARGLDIPKIQYVIHYDVARSPQVYIHRSGRTARANTNGTTVSVVSPEDRPYHESIYAALGVKSLPNVKIDLQILPLLRERVSIAKKIFTQSFVISQKSKEKNWLEQSASEADLDFDDYMDSEINTNDDNNNSKNDAEKKKNLEKLKSKLNYLLNTPLEKANQGTSSRKRGFIVVAK